MNRCMAHRGWSGLAPENTLSAIKMAADDPLISAIEIDVQLSKDGVPVVIHDFTLERTTSGSGLVADHTYAELQQLDAGSWFDQRFAEETIPTLDAVLAVVRGKCKLNIELKTAGTMYPGLGQKVIELVKHHEMQDEVMLTSFDHEVIKAVKQAEPSLATGLIILGRPTLLPEQLAATGANVLSMCYPYLTPELVKAMVAAGMTVVAWTIDEPAAMQAVMELDEAVIICTNHPERMFTLANV